MAEQRDTAVEVTERIVEARIAIHGFILAVVHDPHVAEDIFQEVCLIICRQWRTYDRSRPFRSWALGIAYRKAMQYFERARRRGGGRCGSLRPLDELEARVRLGREGHDITV